MNIFDKVAYWDRRMKGLRGQGDELKPVVVSFSDADDGFPKQGQHLVQVRGKRIQRVDRKHSRRRAALRLATAKNYGYQHSKVGFSHAVNQPGSGFDRKMARVNK